MKGFPHLVAGFLTLLLPAVAAAAPPLEIDHVIIYSAPGAPERAALEKAGFVVAPTVNHHQGQGTSSITVEFLNAFLELIYRDTDIPVAPNLETAAERFRLKGEWRTSGYSPFVLQLHRTPAAPATWPFPTWQVTAEWMGPGKSIEMLSPRETPKVLGFAIPPWNVDTAANEAALNDPVKGAVFRHPNGARRLTGVRVVAPSDDALPPAAKYVSDNGAAQIDVGKEWLMELTLDNGAQHQTRDLRPDLPLIVHY